MRLIFTFVFTFVCLIGNSQNAGPYIPLDFRNADFIWNHASIDSSFIGYEDSTSIEFGFSYDGRSHLQFYNQNLPPIIEDNFMYLVNTNFINFDAGGFLIEKIDLATGKIAWKTGSDIRSTGDRDYVKYSKIVDDRLIVFAYRDLGGRNPRFFFPYLLSGIVNTKIIRKEYDKNSGVLLNEFIADENNPNNQLFLSINSFLDYEKGEQTLKYFTKNIGYTERITTDDEGQFLYVDTLRNTTSNLKWENDISESTLANKIISDNENIYILDSYFSEKVIPDPPQIVLSKYAKNGDLIYSKRILESVEDIYGQLLFHLATDEFIFITAYEDPYWKANPKFLVLDKEGELVQTINPLLFNTSINNNRTICIPNQVEQDFIFFEAHHNDFVRKSWLNIYTLNHDSKLDLLKQIEFDEEGYVLVPQHAWYLDNGDILLHISHRYYDNVEDEYYGFFPNWMRIKPEELGFEPTVSTNKTEQNGAISIHPNPSIHKVSIKIEGNNYKKGNLKIYNSFGKVIISKRINSNEIDLDISNLKAGVYFCSIEDANSKKTLIETFVKVE